MGGGQGEVTRVTTNEEPGYSPLRERERGRSHYPQECRQPKIETLLTERPEGERAAAAGAGAGRFG